MGYWSDVFVTADARRSPALCRAEAALDALIAAVRPGASTGELYTLAAAALEARLHPVLNGGVGHGIGLSLNEPPGFRPGGDAELVEDGVYTLQVGVADSEVGNALLSAIVRNTARGAVVLVRSPEPIRA